MITFKVAQGDLSFSAEYHEPAFDLFRDPWRLQQQLFARGTKHGVRLTDLRPDRGNGSVGEYSLLCYLFNFSVTVKIRLDGVEVLCPEMSRVGQARVDEAAEHRGQWVAVDGDTLVAVAGSLRELLETLRTRDASGSALVHRIG